MYIFAIIDRFQFWNPATMLYVKFLAFTNPTMAKHSFQFVEHIWGGQAGQPLTHHAVMGRHTAYDMCVMIADSYCEWELFCASNCLQYYIVHIWHTKLWMTLWRACGCHIGRQYLKHQLPYKGPMHMISNCTMWKINVFSINVHLPQFSVFQNEEVFMWMSQNS